jgi:heat-inducible transcriptional repressor
VLTPRQALLLSKVVDGFAQTGQPVGSKTLALDPEITAGPSTIRNELAVLEERGLLAHPHTSAGRVPTDAGYRQYVDALMHESPPPPRRFGLELSTMRREVDEAMRLTTSKLSQVTDLLAAVSAPPLHTATVRHVEVLLLQPQIALVVVITSTGAVTKRAFTFDEPVDVGLADWAASYLNERLADMDLGALTLRSRLIAPELSERERDFLEVLAPAFSGLADTVEDTLYVDGASRLLEGRGFDDISAMNDVIRALEHRVTLLSVLRSALNEPTVYLRIGTENTEPELRSASVVGANYGFGHRTLGAVSVIGPVRMDYRRAIRSVRSAASALSEFVEEVYE